MSLKTDEVLAAVQLGQAQRKVLLAPSSVTEAWSVLVSLKTFAR